MLATAMGVKSGFVWAARRTFAETPPSSWQPCRGHLLNGERRLGPFKTCHLFKIDRFVRQ
jgi:hypothetical protein